VLGLSGGPVGLPIALGVGRCCDSIAFFSLILIACLLASFVFSVGTYGWLRYQRKDLRGRGLAMGGIIATVAWAIAIVLLIASFPILDF
jgi:uncharacterized membrane protein